MQENRTSQEQDADGYSERSGVAVLPNLMLVVWCDCIMIDLHLSIEEAIRFLVMLQNTLAGNPPVITDEHFSGHGGVLIKSDRRLFVWGYDLAIEVALTQPQADCLWKMLGDAVFAALKSEYDSKRGNEVAS